MKFDKEFYKDFDEALERWKSLLNLCRNVHLIKAKSSEYYVVCWEK